MITIVDYGMGNLRSVQKAFERLDADILISSKKEDILRAQKLVLPGVGHFKEGMKNLNDLELTEALHKKVMEEKIPILGICLGMQLFTKYSEEGNVNGLGWIPCSTIKFNLNADGKLKVPHMGWNSIDIQKNSKILKNIDSNTIFYFVHSYYLSCTQDDYVCSKTTYGLEFISSIEKNNIFATQFHPEKSHSSGLKVLDNFINQI